MNTKKTCPLPPPCTLVKCIVRVQAASLYGLNKPLLGLSLGDTTLLANHATHRAPVKAGGVIAHTRAVGYIVVVAAHRVLWITRVRRRRPQKAMSVTAFNGTTDTAASSRNKKGIAIGSVKPHAEKHAVRTIGRINLIPSQTP